MLELVAGKQAVQLETVPEPQTGNQYTATGNDCVKQSTRCEVNLRAINRAPEIVADLYREGLGTLASGGI